MAASDVPPFPEILGHDAARRVLARLVARQRLPPALLLSGPDGVGKRTLAIATARRVLCPEAGEHALDCVVCARIRRAADALEAQREEAVRSYSKPDDAAAFNFRLHPDLLLVEPARSRGGERERLVGTLISQARALVPEMAGPPFEAARRVAILDDAHSMNDQTQNALLKCLEEPARTSHLFLVTSRPESLLPTIRSRCQTLRLGRLPSELLAEHLRTRSSEPAQDAALRAEMSEGSLGRALALDLESYRGQRAGLLQRLADLDGSAPGPRLRLADWLRDQSDADEVLSALRSVLRDTAVLAFGGTARLVNEDARESLTALAGSALGPRAAALAAIVAEARQSLRGYLDVSGRPAGAAQPQMALDRLADRVADAS